MSEAFWKIVDGHGLDGIPSDEPEALRMICTRLVRAEAEVARLREAAAWRPIETAPKDGTLFLAWAEPGQHGLPGMHSLCAWHEDAGFCICELRQPTHWKPLRAPTHQP